MPRTHNLFAAGFLMAMAPMAEAGVEWLAIGSWFGAGDQGFVLVYGQPGLSYPRGYYYRTALPLVHRGHRCSSACFEDGEAIYHHQGCPRVQDHFQRYGIDSSLVLSFFAPRAYEEGRTYRFEDVQGERVPADETERTISSPSGAGAGLMPSARPGPLF